MIYDNIDSQLTFEIESAITQLSEQIELNRYVFTQMASNQVLTEEQMYYKTIVLNEGVKEAITEFIQKVVAAISKAWNAFKLIKNTQVKDLISQNPSTLQSNFTMKIPENFEVPKVGTESDNNYKKYMESITVKEFTTNYDLWKRNGSLKSTENFIKSQYPSLVVEGKSIAQVMHDTLFMDAKQTKDTVISKDNITPFVTFIQEFEAEKQAISKDIDSFNTSNKNIKALLDKIISEADHYIGFEIFDILTEGTEERARAAIAAKKAAEQAQSQQQAQIQNDQDNKNKFRSANPQDQQGDNKKKLAEDRKNIVTYYKASTQVFSAKMKSCKAIERACEKIVTNFIKLQLKGDKDNKKEQKPTAQVTTTQSTEIKK